ncbi:hypothetical protein N1851_004937 [Merluccius polli]|uniref:Uncharacterized protein n=1 Tax=Merluccius polli TaxID=89951 RepID=A0AA47N7Y6_MERPO|nr:hypothetical protein N1851_004937 [Merluccius polli]
MHIRHHSAARLLLCCQITHPHTHSREHSTPILKQLQWLPIQHRINFKILLITYKALNNLAPPPYRPPQTSSNTNLLTPITSSKHRTLGDRAFAIAAPTLCYSLHPNIRNSDSNSFKSQLKTHLFKKAYDP